MPSYKKFVLNGDNVSDLTNDSNFLTSVPNHSASLVTSGTFTTARIPNLSASIITSGTFATARIANDAITGAKIADDAIDSEHYVDRSIDTVHIQHDAVDAQKLKVTGNGGITQFLNANGSGGFNWATPPNTNTTYSISAYDNNPAGGIIFTPSSGSATTIEFTDGDLYYNTSGNNIEAGIMDGAITSGKIANGAVTGTQLSTYAVNSSTKLGSSVVTTDKINANAVTPAKANLGWHTQTKIFVTPSEFVVNDDNQYGNLAMVDSGGQAKVMYNYLEAYANIIIPSGYKVTHFRVNGTASVGISGNYSTIGVGTTTSCQPPTSIFTNTLYATNPSSGITADDTNGRYFILGWHPSTTSQYLYGAYLTIAKI